MKIKLRRNRHNLSHFRLGTCHPGELVPVGLVEINPGDTFNHKVSSFMRFLPMNAPLMQNCQVRLHSFFVPHRIIWDKWETFITRTTAPAIPTTNLHDLQAANSASRLADYLGINSNTAEHVGDFTEVSVLAFAAYNKIFNEYYRDQDLVSPLVDDAGIIDVPNDCAVQRVAWQKDTFTSSRPWPQKGADVTIPLGTEAPLVFPGSPESTAYPFVDSNKLLIGGAKDQIVAAAGDITQATRTDSGQILEFASNTNSPPYADLSNSAAATVRAFRRAVELQKLAERLSQFGSRYPEYLASMGVKSSDARQNRPEYLGGGKVQVSFSEVLQTAEGTTSDVGEMKGHGIAPGGTKPYRRFFEEHGFVMTLMSVRPQTVYSQAIPRHFFHGLHDGPNDYYTPELERIGQQEIYNKEIYQTNDGNDEEIFAYADRYYEYRKCMSQVSGDLKVGKPLDYWTWARGFTTRPALNQTFIECLPDTRIFADEASYPIIFGVNHKLIAQRMITNNTIGGII